MARTLKDRTLALAGLFQAAELVSRVAHRGRDIDAAVLASIHSLFAVDSDSVEDVYGGAQGVVTGLKVFRDHVRSSQDRDMDITRYVVALMFLERKLSRRPRMLAELRQGIEGATSQARYFSETHPNVIARLADLYQQTISTLKPKIMVQGENAVLTNPDNAALIRALLLAGIRSAVLWRQCGGTRLELLLRRAPLVETASKLIRSVPDGAPIKLDN